MDPARRPLILVRACSDTSDRSSASSRSVWALRYLAKFSAAISSCNSQRQLELVTRNGPKITKFWSYGLLDLSLVSFDLLLKLIDEVLHAFVVLPVLIGLEREFLDLPFVLPQRFLGVSVSSLFAIKFALELADSLLQFSDSLLSALKGEVLGFVQAVLEILSLELEALPEFFLALCVLLLRAELVG